MSSSLQRFSIGPLGFELATDTGSLREIRFCGHEIVRAIYPAMRDREWATFPPQMEAVESFIGPETIRLFLRARVKGTEMDLSWTAEIEAQSSGRVTYRWRGKAMSDSVTNRTGLCVLHPAEVAGCPCMVEHTDGRQMAGWFPQDIAPHQPFRDIRTITHVVGRGEVFVRMEGDVFEMEDHRNWTDASFKTYCRPLDWPRPYRLPIGGDIEHAVTVEVRGLWASASVVPRGTDGANPRLPGIGFTLPGSIPESLIDRVRALRPAHVRVEATPASLLATLDWARIEAERLDCDLVVGLLGADSHPPNRAWFPARCSVHLFDEERNHAPTEVLAAWRDVGFERIATGTLGDFAALNRVRPPVSANHSHTVFGINAQVHAADDYSILETITQHGVVAHSAHRIGGGRPVVVAPISLGRRSDCVDVRLGSALAAHWLLGSLRRLAEAGCVESATYFQTHGPLGFLREEVVTPVERLLLALAGRETLPPDFQPPA